MSLSKRTILQSYTVPESEGTSAEICDTTLADMAGVGLAADLTSTRESLLSGISPLDDFLGGGLVCGTICEWGIPFGSGGREVVAAFLAGVSRLAERSSDAAPPWILWAHGRSGLTAYPPAWHARGVPLTRTRFAEAGKPVVDLKPVFMDPFFKVIVLDAPRSLSDDDCAFLARQARAHGQVVIILRDYFLGQRRGNVWARLRLNCWCPDPVQNPETVNLRVVRGLAQRQMQWRL